MFQKLCLVFVIVCLIFDLNHQQTIFTQYQLETVEYRVPSTICDKVFFLFYTCNRHPMFLGSSGWNGGLKVLQITRYLQVFKNLLMFVKKIVNGWFADLFWVGHPILFVWDFWTLIPCQVGLAKPFPGRIAARGKGRVSRNNKLDRSVLPARRDDVSHLGKVFRQKYLGLNAAAPPHKNKKIKKFKKFKHSLTSS